MRVRFSEDMIGYRASRAALCLAIVVIATVCLRLRGNIVASGQPMDDIVFLSEDHGACDWVSVFDLASMETVTKGAAVGVSVGRMGATRDREYVYGIPVNSINAIYSMRRLDLDVLRWWTQRLRDTGPETYMGDVEVVGDLRMVLVAHNQVNRQGDPGVVMRRMPNLTAATNGVFVTDHAVAEIISLNDAQTRVALVTVGGSVHVVDPIAGRMVARFDKLPIQRDARMLDVSQMDSRRIVINADVPGAIVVLDVIDGSSRLLDLDVSFPIGGLTISQGEANEGLLAYRTLRGLGIVDISGNEVSHLQSVDMVAPHNVEASNTGPLLSVSWASSGQRLVAAGAAGRADFTVFDVAECGSTLTQRGDITVCPEEFNMPNDILTDNVDRIPEEHRVCERPTETPSPTPTPDDTALATEIPSATSSSPSTLTPTIGATSPPAQVFLPLALRESLCRRQSRSIDVVLAIDTSSSMSEPLPDGRTKLAVAVEAANRFMDVVSLESGDRVGVVAFDRDARLEQELTDDRVALAEALLAMKTGEQTCLPCAVKTAVAELQSERARQGATSTLILLTDGRSNPRPVSEAIEAALRSRASGIVIFTIGVGREIEEEALRSIASRPSYYYPALKAGGLAAIYEAIAVEIPCPPSYYWGGR